MFTATIRPFLTLKRMNFFGVIVPRMPTNDNDVPTFLDVARWAATNRGVHDQLTDDASASPQLSHERSGL